jgi:hypothetical protein
MVGPACEGEQCCVAVHVTKGGFLTFAADAPANACIGRSGRWHTAQRHIQGLMRLYGFPSRTFWLFSWRPHRMFWLSRFHVAQPAQKADIMSKTYHLFISHSWKYDDAYEKMVQFLNEQGISYYDHSVPKNDPVHTNGTDKQLREAIDAKIKGCSGVIILAGVYASYSKWINAEIDISVGYDKPIIAVEPWGSERTSKVVKDAADKIVKWNGKSLADAIKELF